MHSDLSEMLSRVMIKAEEDFVSLTVAVGSQELSEKAASVF